MFCVVISLLTLEMLLVRRCFPARWDIARVCSVCAFQRVHTFHSCYAYRRACAYLDVCESPPSLLLSWRGRTGDIAYRAVVVRPWAVCVVCWIPSCAKGTSLFMPFCQRLADAALQRHWFSSAAPAALSFCLARLSCRSIRSMFFRDKRAVAGVALQSGVVIDRSVR